MAKIRNAIVRTANKPKPAPKKTKPSKGNQTSDFRLSGSKSSTSGSSTNATVARMMKNMKIKKR